MGLGIGLSSGRKFSGKPGFSRPSNDSTPPKIRSGEPDPFKYIIKRTVRSPDGKYVLAEVNYPNCVNFAGNKILLIKTDMMTFLGRNSLDPHFLEEGNDMEIMARFRPTEEGWRAARKYLEMLDPSLKKR